MKLTELLTTVYAGFNESKWIEHNNYVFWAARKHNLALCGSIAIAIARKKAIKIPGDIDLVCGSQSQAFQFINTLQEKLLTKKTYWSTRVNSGTDFCPPGSTTHIRFNCGFWLPICVMVIPEENFKYWRSAQGTMIQDFSVVINAAKAMDERDSKGRIESISEPDGSPVKIQLEDPFIEVVSQLDEPDMPHYDPRPFEPYQEDGPEHWDMRGFTSHNPYEDK